MSINSKSTKAEILAAYKEAEKQKKALEAKVQNQVVPAKAAPIASKVANKAAVDPHQNAIAANKIDHKNISQTIIDLEQIKTGFGGAVSGLSAQLIAEATQLETLRGEIASEKLELENLYQLKEIDDSAIANLLDRYQANANQYAAQVTQQQEDNEQEITALKQAWLKEQAAHQRTFAREKEEYRQSQARDQEEYEYNLDKARDFDEEEYEQQKKVRQLDLETSRQTLEQQWQQQEAEIAQQEQEYAAAREKVTAFDEQLRAKIKQGREEGKGIGIYQAKVKADLKTKEIEGEQQNYELRIETLEQTIRHQNTRISKLSLQLNSSLQQVQDLAVKAIEGTANRNSFEAMKAIAMEQVKTQQKGK